MVPVAVRVGVEFVDRSVGRPSCVGDADGTCDPADGFELGFEVRDASDRFGDLEPSAVDRGDPSGVVSTVLEPLEPFEEQWLSGFVSDIGDDATHRRTPGMGAMDAPES